jgi:serpin B
MKCILFSLLLLSGSLSAQSDKNLSGLNQHSQELAANLFKPGKNLFCSPLSLSNALAMVYAGARGETRSEMERVMHYHDTSTYTFFNRLQQSLNAFGSENNKTQLSLANALWSRTRLKPQYQQLMRDKFSASFFPLTNEVPINAWAYKKTNGLIKDLLQPGSIDPDVRLILTNALYFKAKWKNTFDTARSTTEPFYLSNNTTVDCRMMHQETRVKYTANTTLEAIEMPYSDGRTAMELYLPKAGHSIESMLKSTTAEELEKIRKSMVLQKVDVNFPKFRFESTHNLKAPLMEMGLTQAFSQGANFSGISEEPLFISTVLQKAVVDVEESGTEAAAVTVIMMQTTSAMHRDDLHPVFYANRPFFFVIRDLQTGAILFNGVVENPTSKE